MKILHPALCDGICVRNMYTIFKQEEKTDAHSVHIRNLILFTPCFPSVLDGVGSRWLSKEQWKTHGLFGLYRGLYYAVKTLILVES